MRASLAIGCAATLLAVGIACSHDDPCRDNPCDEHGQRLVYAPYIIPGIGIYGMPGYHPPRTIYPGTPGYRPTFQGRPPNYRPQRSVPPPRPPQPPKTGSGATVQRSAPKSAPKVTAPKPAPKPAPAPKIRTK